MFGAPQHQLNVLLTGSFLKHSLCNGSKLIEGAAAFTPTTLPLAVKKIAHPSDGSCKPVLPYVDADGSVGFSTGQCQASATVDYTPTDQLARKNLRHIGPHGLVASTTATFVNALYPMGDSDFVNEYLKRQKTSQSEEAVTTVAGVTTDSTSETEKPANVSWADFVKPKAQLVAMSGSSTGLNITCTPQAVADRSFQFTADMTVQLPLSCVAMGRTVYKLDTSFLSDSTGRYTDAWNIHCDVWKEVFCVDVVKDGKLGRKCANTKEVTFQRAVNAVEFGTDTPTTIVPCTKESAEGSEAPEFGLCVKDGNKLVASEKYVMTMEDKGAAAALLKLSQYHTFTPLCTISTIVG